MTEENKKTTDSNIESMQPKDATNLWHGIRDGLKLFKNDPDDYGKPARIPALMVLTDGCPNHMYDSYQVPRFENSKTDLITRCPTQGYVPKLRGMGKLPATINTFGFGYNLRSGLLKSIAEIGGGNYSFIPDAGMVVSISIQPAHSNPLTNQPRAPYSSTRSQTSNPPLPKTPSSASNTLPPSASKKPPAKPSTNNLPRLPDSKTTN